MTKVLKLIFKDENGKDTVIVLHNPKDVDADTAKSVMQKIVDANIFEKAGLNLYATIGGANTTKLKVLLFLTLNKSLFKGRGLLPPSFL